MSDSGRGAARIEAVTRQLKRAFGTRPFHTSQAMALGFSEDRIERACIAGLVERLGRGWYAATDQGSVGLARLQVLQQANPGVVACGATAAALWGLPPPPGRDVCSDTVEIAFRADAGGLRGRRLGVRARRWSIPDHHIAVGPQGQVTTDPLRTAIDLARGLPMPFALVSLDAVLRLNVTSGMSVQEARRLLQATWAEARSCSGMRAVGLAIPFANPLAESPLESIVRGRIIEVRLPVPLLQVEVMGASGRWYRSDLGLDLPGDPAGSYRLLIEADGLLKYQCAGDLAEEKKRQHDLERRGHCFVRVLYREGVYEPGPFLAQIRHHLNG